MKVLFVCTGNTCRSPLAEAFARRDAIARGWLDVEIESAGTHAQANAPASDGSLLVGIERGVSLASHAAQPLTKDLIGESDLILCMGPRHVAAAQALGGTGRTFLLTEYADEGSLEDGVPDPFGGDLDTYRETADVLEVLTRSALDRFERERLKAQGT